MEIDPYCQRQNCSPLNVLFIDVYISLIMLGVPPLGGGYNYITRVAQVCQRQLGFLVYINTSILKILVAGHEPAVILYFCGSAPPPL